mmetsp:Transcript_12623/g.50465  ORF Transcript_12623/g.50465 Transcript_12623/m.50465 type:complete len:407 (+) Transcript_12623:1860-3080(+)
MAAVGRQQLWRRIRQEPRGQAGGPLRRSVWLFCGGGEQHQVEDRLLRQHLHVRALCRAPPPRHLQVLRRRQRHQPEGQRCPRPHRRTQAQVPTHWPPHLLRQGAADQVQIRQRVPGAGRGPCDALRGLCADAGVAAGLHAGGAVPGRGGRPDPHRRPAQPRGRVCLCAGDGQEHVPRRARRRFRHGGHGRRHRVPLRHARLHQRPHAVLRRQRGRDRQPAHEALPPAGAWQAQPLFVRRAGAAAEVLAEEVARRRVPYEGGVHRGPEDVHGHHGPAGARPELLCLQVLPQQARRVHRRHDLLQRIRRRPLHTPPRRVRRVPSLCVQCVRHGRLRVSEPRRDREHLQGVHAVDGTADASGPAARNDAEAHGGDRHQQRQPDQLRRVQAGYRLQQATDQVLQGGQVRQ